MAGEYGYLEGDPGRVLITAGAQEAIFLALMTLVDEGDEVLVPDPGFTAYPTLVRMAGGVPVPYRMPASGDFAFDVARLRARLGPRTRAVVIGSPSNPTGRALGRADLAAVAEALRDAASLREGVQRLRRALEDLGARFGTAAPHARSTRNMKQP